MKWKTGCFPYPSFYEYCSEQYWCVNLQPIVLIHCVCTGRQYDKKKSEYQNQEKSDLQSELTLTKSEVSQCSPSTRTNMYQHVPTLPKCISMYQHIPICTNMYQHVKICTNKYQHILIFTTHTNMYQHIPTCTNTYQYVSIHTSTYQHIPICINMYQHILMHINMYQHIPVNTNTYWYVPSMLFFAGNQSVTEAKI